MTELANYYDELCAEIIRVREVGYENTDIIAMSEEFFGICDDATRLAEDYSQEKATALNRLEGLVIIDIVGLVATVLAFVLFNRSIGPVAVPPLQPQTAESKRRFAQAQQRRALRQELEARYQAIADQH